MLRTRSLGPITLFVIFDLLAFAALDIRLAGPLGWSLALMTLATLWAGWAVFCNHLVCCKRCRNSWIGYPLSFWLLFTLTPSVIKGRVGRTWGGLCRHQRSAARTSVSAGGHRRLAPKWKG